MATVTDTTARDRWERENAAAPTRAQPPTTVSSVPVEPLYTPDSLPDWEDVRVSFLGPDAVRRPDGPVEVRVCDPDSAAPRMMREF